MGDRAHDDSECNMDPTLWSELPDHITYKILALLPLRSFVRFQSVCRRWTRLLHSRVFLEEFSQSPVEKPWFAIVDDGGQVHMYMPSNEKWYSMPDTFLPQNSFFLATDKGLILSRVRRRVEGLQDRLIVRNPFTTSHRHLSPQSLHGPGYRMVVEENKKKYAIYHFGRLHPWSGSDRIRDEHALEAYCSLTNRWEVLDRVNPDVLGGLPPYAFDDTQIVVCNSSIYCRLRSFFGIMVYNLHQRVWFRLPWPVPPSIAAFQQIVYLQGRLMMVVGIKDHLNRFRLQEYPHMGTPSEQYGVV